MSEAGEKKRKLMALPVYVLIDENTVVLPDAEVKLVKPSELPDEGNYYVLTKDGLHINKNTAVVRALTKVKEVPFLASHTIATQLNLPKLPPLILARAWRLFSRVWSEHKAEAELILLYDPQEKVYDLWCPKQKVSGAGVDYNLASEPLEEKMVGLRAVGSIHSHCNFSASHSHTDIGDENRCNTDGLHITIGHVDRPHCSLAASVVVGSSKVDKERMSIPPPCAILGLTSKTAEDAGKHYYVSAWTTEFWALDLEPEELECLKAYEKEEIIPVWMPKIEKETWVASGSSQSHWEEIEEEPEAGEWHYQAGQWVFINDEELGLEEDTDEIEGVLEPEAPDATNEPEAPDATTDETPEVADAISEGMPVQPDDSTPNLKQLSGEDQVIELPEDETER